MQLDRRGAQARSRSDDWLADQKIELLLTQGKMRRGARACCASCRATAASSRWRAKSTIVLRGERRRRRCEAWMAERDVASKAVTGAELIELARLQYLAGDAAAARATLAHAERILPLSSADMFDGSQIRHDYSAALFHAGIELKGGGDAGARHEDLEQLDRMLDQLREEWRPAFRAVFACAPSRWRMQGKTAEAQAALEHRLETRLARRRGARAATPISRAA